MAELGKLQRIATRYSEIMREQAYLIGLMNLAARTGDTKLLARTKERLAGVEMQSEECSAAFEAMRHELGTAKTDGSDLHGTVAETLEYATA